MADSIPRYQSAPSDATAFKTGLPGSGTEGTAARHVVDVWFQQLRALVMKCLVMIARRRVALLAILVAPAAFILILDAVYINLTSLSLSSHPATLSKCTPYDIYNRPDPTRSCVTLLYGPKTPETDAIMQNVAEGAGLVFGTDVVGQNSALDMSAFLLNNLYSNSVDTAVYFNLTMSDFARFQVTYHIWVNATLQEAYVNDGKDSIFADTGAPGRIVAVQAAVDGGILQFLLGPEAESVSEAAGEDASRAFRATSEAFGAAAVPTISLNVGPFSSYTGGTNVRVQGPASILLILAGGTFAITGGVVSALLIMSSVVSEKQRDLLGALRAIGLFESTYWLSWFFSYLPLLAILALVTMGIAGATHLPHFEYADYSVHIVGFFVFMVSLTSLALCCASMVKRTRYVNVCSFLLFAVAVIMSTIFPITGLYDQLYRPGMTPIVMIVVAPLPWLHYGNFLFDILLHVENANGNSGGSDNGGGGGGGGRRLEAGLWEPEEVRAGTDFDWLAFRNHSRSRLAEETVGEPTVTAVSEWFSAWAYAAPSSAATAAASFAHDAFADVRAAPRVTSEGAGSLPSPSSAPAAARWRAAAEVSALASAFEKESWFWSPRVVDPTTLSDAALAEVGLVRRADGALLDLELVDDDATLGRLLSERGAASFPEDSASWDRPTGSASLDRQNARRRARRMDGPGPSNKPKSASGYAQFTWSDMFEEGAITKTLVNGLPVLYHPHSPAFYLSLCCYILFGYLLLAWYLSQVMASDLGAAQPFYFPFSPYYWNLAKPESKIEAGDTLAQLQRLSSQENSIRVHKLSKTYENTQALKEVSLTLAPGQLFALLGQNGSGKSTFCKVLSGLLNPTHGEVFMFGKAISTEVGNLRDVMGSCPQDDLLWEELSARQHLELFAQFKGVPAMDLDAHVERRLHDVSLTKVAEAPVMTFSGGMKRRLSVAMSAVGDPKIIFLDEPTTGLDPLSRRRVWRLIQHLKVGRILVLTTHSMEEADALGDNIGILVSGRLRAVGSSLFLKNRFGAGYQLSLLTHPTRVAELKDLVLSQLPGAEIVGEMNDDDAARALLEGDATGLGIGVAGAAAAARVHHTDPYGGVGSSGASGANAEGNVLAQRAASGAITVAVPRNLTRLIPNFLQLLSQYDDEAANQAASEASAAATAAGMTEKASAEAAAAARRVAAQGKLVREWGISNSTLTEVFLRLASQNKGLNAAVTTASADTTVVDGASPLVLASAAPTLAGAGVGGGGAAAAAAAAGGALTPATRRLELVRRGAAAASLGRRNQFLPGALGAATAAAGGHLVGEPLALFQGTHVTAVALFFADDPVAQNDEVARLRASLADAARHAAAATARPGPSLTGGEKGDAVESVPSPLRALGAQAAAGAGVGAGVLEVEDEETPMSSPGSLETPASAYTTVKNSSRGMTAEQLGEVSRNADVDYIAPPEFKNQEVEPVSLMTQLLAVLIMRLQVQAKAKWTNCCYLIILIVGIVVTVVSTPSAPTLGATMIQCPGGWYVDMTLPFCSAQNVSDFMTGAFNRSFADGSINGGYANTDDFIVQGTSFDGLHETTTTMMKTEATTTTTTMSPPPARLASEQTAMMDVSPMADLARRSAWGRALAEGVGDAAGETQDTGAMLGTDYPLVTDVYWIYRYQCVNITATNYCGWFNTSSWSHWRSSDWFPYYYTINAWYKAQVTSGTPTQPPQIWYVDSSVEGDVPLAEWDLLGYGRGTTGWMGQVNYVDVTGDTVRTAADLDQVVYNNQESVYLKSGDGTGTCGSYYREVYQLQNASVAMNYMTANFPDAGVAVSRASMGSTPILNYEVRVYAQFPSSGLNPGSQRANLYDAVNVVYPTSSYCNFISIYQSNDNWFDSAQYYSSYLPVNLLVNSVNNAFLRTAVKNRADAKAKASVKNSAPSSSLSSDSDVAADPFVPDPPQWIPRGMSPYITFVMQQFPPLEFYAKAATSNAGFSALLWPLFTLFLFPGFAAIVAQEKQSKLFLMMSIAGLRDAAYWVGTYVYSFLLFMIVGLIYVGAGYLAGVSSFTNTGFGLFLALLLTWAHAQAGFAILLGTVVQSPRATTVISYMIVVVVAVATFLITSLVTPWPTAINWVPFISYTRAAVLINNFGGSEIHFGSELQGALLITLLEGTVALLVGMYLHVVIPGPEQTGVVDSPFFCLRYVGVAVPQSYSWSDALCCRSFRKANARLGLGAEGEATRGAGSINGPKDSLSASLLGSSVTNPLMHELPAPGSAASSSSSAAASASLVGAAGSAVRGYGAALPADQLVVSRGLQSEDGEEDDDVDVAIERRRVAGTGVAGKPDAWFYSTARTALMIDHLVKDFPSRIATVDEAVVQRRKQRSYEGGLGNTMLNALDSAWQFFLTFVGLNTMSGTKRAVDELAFGVQYGECFGLLGPNGCGKTTTLSILSGHITATGGQAFVGGFDCQTDIRRVYRTLGICPQFDCVFDDLTVREHLFFYARLKGVPAHRLTAEVQSIAEKIELDGDPFNLAATQLSGGMRRRLSIGIALIGNPQVVMMDEPTTGLDPDTRRQIWSIIQAEKSAGRCLVITTHSMEEAEALCSRIGIMFNGRLQCVGTQLRLKNRFGEGYRLSLTLAGQTEDVAERADAILRREVHPDTERTVRVGSSATYQLPRAGIDVARVFQALEDLKRTDGCPFVEWGLSQSSLEDVFISVVEDAERRAGVRDS